jgi:hypothetical protein
MPTNAEHQRAHKARMAEAGFRQLQLWVRPACVPELRRVAELLRATPDLSLERLTNTRSKPLCVSRSGKATKL